MVSTNTKHKNKRIQSKPINGRGQPNAKQKDIREKWGKETKNKNKQAVS